MQFHSLIAHREDNKTTGLAGKPPHITSVHYCGGCSVHWRLFSTSGDNINTVGDSISTVGYCFSTVEVAQYGGGIASLL